MRRREFMSLLGGTAAAWPLAARAQRPTPVVGVLVVGSPQLDAGFTDNLRRGLGAQGFVDSQNVVLNIRWAAETRYDQLLALRPTWRRGDVV
jgi:putative ABC transport system substrate-binding protein